MRAILRQFSTHRNALINFAKEFQGSFYQEASRQGNEKQPAFLTHAVLIVNFYSLSFFLVSQIFIGI
jgi:uncharacterized membrane protein